MHKKLSKKAENIFFGYKGKKCKKFYENREKIQENQ